MTSNEQFTLLYTYVHDRLVLSNMSLIWYKKGFLSRVVKMMKNARQTVFKAIKKIYSMLPKDDFLHVSLSINSLVIYT